MVFGVLAQLAEFERATLSERTNAGLAAAPILADASDSRPISRRRYSGCGWEEGKTYAQLAALFHVSRSVVWRAVNVPARG